MEAYRALEELFARHRILRDATGILGWDAQTLMPSGAAEGRAEQIALLRGMSHDLLIASQTADLLDVAMQDRLNLEVWQAANLREMRRAYDHASSVPHDLVVASSKATSRAEMVWRDARRTSDFGLLSPHLEAVVELQREVGRCKGEALGLETYDALLEQYDPGLRQLKIDPIFRLLRSVNAGLIPGQRGGVKPGQWWVGHGDMERAPIGALSMSP